MYKEIIYNALKNIGIGNKIIEFEIPKHEKLGDISTPIAMALAKELKKPLRDIAESIVKSIDNNKLFESIEISGPGFINFRLKKDYLFSELKRLYNEKTSFFKMNIGMGKRVQIEFVSANPTGPLHLGHGRGAALGDALANLLRKAGYNVEREFYINDAGRQVKLLGESVFAKYQVLSGESYKLPDDGYRGGYVDELAKDILKKEGEKFLNKRFDDVSDYFINYSFRKMVDNIKDDLIRFGVEFDSWQSERELYEKGFVKDTINKLKKKGLIYEREGATWFKSSEFGDEKDRVIIKSDMEYTYFASDISYHMKKIERGFDELINIWGADHHGYIPRINSVIKALGFNEKKLNVLLVQMVTLLRSGKPVQMSKRAGEFVTLKEVIEEIGSDITRFIFLTRRPDSHLEFDIDMVKKESSENPVFYVQYAYARINSIFRKAEEKGIKTKFSNDTDITLLNTPEELRIIKKLIFYPLFFEGAVRTEEPHRITFYLQELSSLFHQYYNIHRVLSEDEALTGSRLILCASVKIVLEEGISILGISTPERM